MLKVLEAHNNQKVKVLHLIKGLLSKIVILLMEILHTVIIFWTVTWFKTCLVQLYRIKLNKGLSHLYLILVNFVDFI